MLTRIIIAICICLFNSAMAKSLLHGMEKLTLLNHFVIQLFRVNVNGMEHGSSLLRHSVCGRLMRLAELFERASDFSADYCLMVLKCCYLWLYYVNLHRANADGKIINNSPMFYCSFMHLQPLETRQRGGSSQIGKPRIPINFIFHFIRRAHKNGWFYQSASASDSAAKAFCCFRE